MSSSGGGMKLKAPHIIGIAILAVGVIAIIVVQLLGLGRGGSAQAGATHVTGVVGSEKVAFFEDPAVVDAFAEHGLTVDVTSAGSWRMAELADLNENDFAFPASEVAAENIRNRVEGAGSLHQPFFSPMAIATFEPIMELLETAGVSTRNADGVWTIDMPTYLELVAADTRWNQLEGAAASYDSPRSVLITSTDIRSSNSASQYLALAAYAASDSEVITSRAQADALLPQLTRLFLAQGYAGASSAAPFDDYLSQGISAVPMAMIYEGQFLEEQLRENSRIREGMVLAYPSPTIFSSHTAVTFSDAGEQVMQLLETDPRLAELLAVHGFRPTGSNSGAFQGLLADRDLAASYLDTGALVNVAQEPSYEVMDYLLTAIGDAYDLASGGVAPPSDGELDPDAGDSAAPDDPGDGMPAPDETSAPDEEETP